MEQLLSKAIDRAETVSKLFDKNVQIALHAEQKLKLCMEISLILNINSTVNMSKTEQQKSNQNSKIEETLATGLGSAEAQSSETSTITLEQLYECCKPCVLVQFENENGELQTEKIGFESLDDFKKHGICKKSKILLNLQLEQDFLQDMIQQLKSNAALRGVLDNEESRNAFLATLEALIQKIPE